MKARLARATGAITLDIGIAGLFLTMLLVSAAPSASSAAAVTWTDNFDDPSLSNRWSWIREDPTHWSLTAKPDFLQITTQGGGLANGTNNSKNLLLQEAPIGDFDIRTRVIFTPTENFQLAGLLVYQDDDNWLSLARAFCDAPAGCIGNSIYFDREENGALIGSNFATTTVATGEAYLRLFRQHTVYTGFVSPDGLNWVTVGTHTVISGLVPSKVGLVAHDTLDTAAEILASFDYFVVDDYSNRVFLPLALKSSDIPTNDIPRFVQNDFTQLEKISQISRFRSAAGHDYSDQFESCRSMKHYYAPYDAYRENNNIKVYSPVDGVIDSIMDEGHGASEGLTNKQIRIRSASYPEFIFVIFHTDLISADIIAGKNVQAGELLGHARMYYPDLAEYAHDFDIAVWFWPEMGSPGTRYISFFETMTDARFNNYAARGVQSRSELIISKDARNADPLTCDGQQFTSTGSLENWVTLN